jgi:hypothetical protein
MNISEKFTAIPRHVYVLIFSAIFVVASLSTYFLREDTRLLDKKIEATQKDYAEMLQLKDSYEGRKRAFEKVVSKKAESRAISLAVVEDMVAKNFVGGSLSTLQPAASREEKGQERTAVEVKVTGAPLGEIISFVKAVENSGLHVDKLRLSLAPANPMSLDMQATVTERRSHG